MKHRIDDAAFAAQWYIENVSLYFQSYSLSLTLQQAEFGITAHELGYNIYLLTVPIVSDDVLITAVGVLRQQGATIISSNQANTNIRTGPVVPVPAAAARVDSNVQVSSQSSYANPSPSVA
jgi:hypothetical protein